MIKTCLTCGRPFQSSNPKKIYCCNYCYPSEGKNYKNNPKVKKVCTICGKEFMGFTKSKFCSLGCFLINDENKKRLYRKESKKLRPKAKCVWCGSEFSKIEDTHLYCCFECGEEFRRMRKRILKHFEGDTIQELEKLKKEGKNYEEKSKIEC